MVGPLMSVRPPKAEALAAAVIDVCVRRAFFIDAHFCAYRVARVLFSGRARRPHSAKVNVSIGATGAGAAGMASNGA